MKTLIINTALFILVFSSGLMSQDFDFRNTSWGMDSIQVKKAETTKLVFSKKNSLVYNGKLGELETRIVYNFNTSKQLFSASYIITLSGMESNNPMYYLNNFRVLQDLLTQKYKEPYKKANANIGGKGAKQEEWANNFISDNRTLESKWKTGRTNIILSLYSINDALCIEIIYTSLENNISEDQKNKEEILKGL